MSLTLRRRRVVVEIPDTWMGRMKAQAGRAGQRLGPMADQAKVVAAHRFEDARYWTAPRLEGAAHRVEDQIAPAVSAMLVKAAEKIDPTPPKSRRWPMIALVAGLVACAVGYMFYRRNAQQWTDHMKESASDATEWVKEKTGKATDSAEKIASNASDAAHRAT